MTQIQRTISEIAQVMRICSRMENARLLTRGENVDWKIDRAIANAQDRQSALEDSLLAMEPETIADGLVFAAMAVESFDCFADDAGDRETVHLEAHRRRVAALMGAALRAIASHVEMTPDLEAFVKFNADMSLKAWPEIVAAAEIEASALERNLAESSALADAA